MAKTKVKRRRGARVRRITSDNGYYWK
jgi:hypothetical protein